MNRACKGKTKMYFSIKIFYASAALHLVKLEKVTSKLHNYTALNDLIAYESLVLQGEVTVREESNAEYNYLKLEAKFEGTEHFHEFFVLSLNECVQVDNFYCVQENNTFHISATLRVTPDLNQSEWILTGEYNKETFRSNVITLPSIRPLVEASLLEYNRSNLNCQNYLLMDNTFVLEGIVRVNQHLEKSEGYFNIEWGKINSTFEIFYTISLAQCCSPSSLTWTKQGNDYKLHLITLATIHLNQSLWRITGRYNEVEFISNTIKLPDSFDLSKVVMTLNGQTLSPSNTSLTIKDDEELTLCCEFAPSHCKPVITLNHTKSVSDLNCVHYRPSQYHVETTYTFGYIACGNDTFTEVVTIAIIINAVQGRVSLVTILTVVFIVLAIIVLILVLIGCYYRVKNRNQNQPANSSSGEPLVSRFQVNNPSYQENRNSGIFDMEAVSSESDGENNERELKATEVNLLKCLRSHQNTKSTQTTEIKWDRNKTEIPFFDRMTRSKQKEFDEKNAKRTASPRRRRIIKQKKFSEDNDDEMLTRPISESNARRQKKFNIIYPDFFTPKMQSKNTELEERKLSFPVKHTRNKLMSLKQQIPERTSKSKQLEFDEENAKMMNSYKSDEKINSLVFKNLRIRRSHMVQL